MTEPMVTIKLPLGDWNQIVSDIENMCGCSEEHIEILQQVEILGTHLPEVSEAVRSPQEPCGHPDCPCTSQEAR